MQTHAIIIDRGDKNKLAAQCECGWKFSIERGFGSITPLEYTLFDYAIRRHERSYNKRMATKGANQ